MLSYPNPSTLLRSGLLTAVSGLEHGFGTRHSGLSQDHMASLQQVHSARYLKVTAAGRAGEGDALITAEPELAVSVRTADCLPILIVDPVRRAVAAIHAGWRGTAARIVVETVSAMVREFGTEPGHLVAAIGPGIGGCCYEVGEEVARQFGRSGAGRVDLAQQNRSQLRDAGVDDSRIDLLGLCTFCDTRFYSWRREREQAGRMISFIRLTRGRDGNASLFHQK